MLKNKAIYFFNIIKENNKIRNNKIFIENIGVIVNKPVYCYKRRDLKFILNGKVVNYIIKTPIKLLVNEISIRLNAYLKWTYSFNTKDDKDLYLIDFLNDHFFVCKKEDILFYLTNDEIIDILDDYYKSFLG